MRREFRGTAILLISTLGAAVTLHMSTHPTAPMFAQADTRARTPIVTNPDIQDLFDGVDEIEAEVSRMETESAVGSSNDLDAPGASGLPDRLNDGRDAGDSTMRASDGDAMIARATLYAAIIGGIFVILAAWVGRS